MTASNNDDQLSEIYPTMLNELNCSRLHCCGHHGIGPVVVVVAVAVTLVVVVAVAVTLVVVVVVAVTLVVVVAVAVTLVVVVVAAHC